MVEKLLMSGGVLAVVIVAGLGFWGWQDRDETRARHEASVRSENQEQFCAVLSAVLQPLTGGDANIPLPQEPSVTDPDGNAAGAFAAGYFLDQLEADVPPDLEDEIAILRDAFDDVEQNGDPTRLIQGDVQGAVSELLDYQSEYCT